LMAVITPSRPQSSLTAGPGHGPGRGPFRPFR
jgi:hypothetical protein